MNNYRKDYSKNPTFYEIRGFSSELKWISHDLLSKQSHYCKSLIWTKTFPSVVAPLAAAAVRNQDAESFKKIVRLVAI